MKEIDISKYDLNSYSTLEQREKALNIMEKAFYLLAGRTCDNCGRGGSFNLTTRERFECRVETGSKMFKTKVIGPVDDNTCEYWTEK